MRDTLLAWDQAALLWINGFAGRSDALDVLMRFVSTSEVFKGLPVMMLVWGLWFADPRRHPRYRPRILALLATSVAAIVLGRSLALLLPFRLRPISDPLVPNVLPFGLDDTTLEGWSSMPSDHAVLFFALATGIALIDLRWGMLALLHAALVISLPRVYLGLHFPGDVLAGALLGAACAFALVPPLSRATERSGAVDRVLAYPVLFYPAMFLATFQSASMFDSLRAFASTAFGFLRSAFT